MVKNSSGKNHPKCYTSKEANFKELEKLERDVKGIIERSDHWNYSETIWILWGNLGKQAHSFSKRLLVGRSRKLLSMGYCCLCESTGNHVVRGGCLWGSVLSREDLLLEGRTARSRWTPLIPSVPFWTITGHRKFFRL